MFRMEKLFLVILFLIRSIKQICRVNNVIVAALTCMFSFMFHALLPASYSGIAMANMKCVVVYLTC